MKIKLLLAIISISLLITCSSKTETKTPKNIIFLIGDGMGVSQVYAALTAKKDNLNIAQCKHIGFIKTFKIYMTGKGQCIFSLDQYFNHFYF